MREAEGIPVLPAVGHSRSETCAQRRRAALRMEASHLASDPADRAELALLREELDKLVPPWPAD